MQPVQLAAVVPVASTSWDTYGPSTPSDAVQQISPSTGGSLSNLMKAVHYAALSLTPTKQTALSPSDLVAGRSKKQAVKVPADDDDGEDDGGGDEDDEGGDGDGGTNSQDSSSSAP